MVGMNTVLEF
jgi:hypothetical protein